MIDVKENRFQSVIEALNDCAQACNSCAIDCLNENEGGRLARCVQLERDCAGICTLTSEFLSRESQFAATLARDCASVCDACAEECRRHSNMQHCRDCAEICSGCADECRRVGGSPK